MDDDSLRRRGLTARKLTTAGEALRSLGSNAVGAFERFGPRTAILAQLAHPVVRRRG